MKKRLNNKGYMLVEIILSSAIALGVAYFLTDLTIKLKNKNDDLLVKTLVYTDQTIIYNQLAKDIYNNGSRPTCEEIKSKMSISENTFKYNGFTNIVSEYATIETPECIEDANSITVTIPIKVEQLQKDNFDVVFKFKK